MASSDAALQLAASEPDRLLRRLPDEVPSMGLEA